MKDSNVKTNKSSRRGHHEGNIRQRSDGRWEVRLSAGMDYKTGQSQAHLHLLQHPAGSHRHPAGTSLQCAGERLARPTLAEPRPMVQPLAGRLHAGPGQAEHLRQLQGLLHAPLLGAGQDHTEEARTRSVAGFLQLQIPGGRTLPQNTAQHADRRCTNVYSKPSRNGCWSAIPARRSRCRPSRNPRSPSLPTDQQRAVVQASYHHRYGVFIRLDLATGLRIGELAGPQVGRHRPGGRADADSPHDQPAGQIRGCGRRQPHRDRPRHPQNPQCQADQSR